MLCRPRLLVLLLWLIVPTALSAQTYTVQTVPNPKLLGGYVSDPDDILDEADEGRLNALCAKIEDSATAQIAVVILQSIGTENPKDFATRLFNAWGIGYADKDNGLLVLTVMDQRRTEFETGYGMEAVLPDAICYRIGMQELVPHFREGEYGQGLIAALSRMGEIILDPDAQADIQSEMDRVSRADRPRGLWVLWGYLALAGLLFLVNLVWNGAHLWSKEDLHDKYMAIRKFHWLGWAFLFPLPFLLFYFINRGLLNRLRNQTRYSKITGAPMRKMSEGEDDSFLEPGQIIEEQIGSVDYDVWVTDSKDDALILRYATRFSKYKPCPKCGFKTYYLARTETLRAATYSRAGKGQHVFECKNCGYQKVDTFSIAKKAKASGGGFSSGGGGFSGGSFGGGSSGGGGAGVSW